MVLLPEQLWNIKTNILLVSAVISDYDLPKQEIRIGPTVLLLATDSKAITVGDFYKLKFCHSDIYMYICIVKQE